MRYSRLHHEASDALQEDLYENRVYEPAKRFWVSPLSDQVKVHWKIAQIVPRTGDMGWYIPVWEINAWWIVSDSVTAPT